MLTVEPLTSVSDVSDNVAPVDLLPRILHEFTDVQRHVLARIAVHTWRFDGEIPYTPPTSWQCEIAFVLAEADMRLLALVSKRPAFRLTRLGIHVVSRLFHIVPARWSIEREIELEFLRALMRNKWETH
jgi:hypothetical protein